MAGEPASAKVQAAPAQERTGRQGVVMAMWSNNIEAVARTACGMKLALNGVTKEQLAADADMR